MKNYDFYIMIDGIDSKTLILNRHPQIFKLEKNSKINKINGEEIEGPFSSLSELKKTSSIYSKIENSKTKQSILNPTNIKEVKKITFVPFEHSYEPNFIKLFLHTWIGKISDKDVSGIHFHTPENTRILEIIEFNKETGVYSAKISSLNKEKNIWVKKSKPTNFFPDNWTVQKLFKEMDIAFTNKTHIEGSIYMGNTTENIKVKFIIKNGNALTMYPLIK